jgi:hypothetical protein
MDQSPHCNSIGGAGPISTRRGARRSCNVRSNAECAKSCSHIRFPARRLRALGRPAAEGDCLGLPIAFEKKQVAGKFWRLRGIASGKNTAGHRSCIVLAGLLGCD